MRGREFVLPRSVIDGSDPTRHSGYVGVAAFT
jgi:hypothetical protein